jgi:hypothetical protein
VNSEQGITPFRSGFAIMRGRSQTRAESFRKSRPIVAFGPEMPGWGSWEWLGSDLRQELARYYETLVFSDSVPRCDVAVIVKHPLEPEIVTQLAQRSSVVYCPVDHYGSVAEIDGDAALLRRCARILVHCERLRRYFEPYAPVEFIDHHVKFTPEGDSGYRREGYILWIGVRSNIAPLVSWVNSHPLPSELCVLTNLEDPARRPHPSDFGFSVHHQIRIENWTRERHIELVVGARGALDVKGDDFRSRHKPPAKAIDFIAAGLPLAMNPESSPVEHLRRMGFEVTSPLDWDRWLSQEYWEETRRFGWSLRELLSRERIGRRLRNVIEDVLAQ